MTWADIARLTHEPGRDSGRAAGKEKDDPRGSEGRDLAVVRATLHYIAVSRSTREPEAGVFARPIPDSTGSGTKTDPCFSDDANP